MDTGGTSPAKRRLGNSRVLPVQSPQIGPEYSNKSAPEEKAQLAKNRAQIGEKQRELEHASWWREGMDSSGWARTHQRQTLERKAHRLVAQKKKKRGEYLRCEQLSRRELPRRRAPPFTFLIISFTFRAALRQTRVTAKRDPEVSRLKPDHVQVLFWIFRRTKWMLDPVKFHDD